MVSGPSSPKETAEIQRMVMTRTMVKSHTAIWRKIWTLCPQP